MFEEILECAQILSYAEGSYDACRCDCCVGPDGADACEQLILRNKAVERLKATIAREPQGGIPHPVEVRRVVLAHSKHKENITSMHENCSQDRCGSRMCTHRTKCYAAQMALTLTLDDLEAMFVRDDPTAL